MVGLNQTAEDVNSFSKKPSGTHQKPDFPRNLAHSILLDPNIDDDVKINIIQRLKRGINWNFTADEAKSTIKMGRNSFERSNRILKELGFLSRTQANSKKGLRVGFGYSIDRLTLPPVNRNKRGSYQIVHSSWPDIPGKSLLLFSRIRTYGDDTVAAASELVRLTGHVRRTVVANLQPAIDAEMLFAGTHPAKRGQKPELWVSPSKAALAAHIERLKTEQSAKIGARQSAKTGAHHQRQESSSETNYHYRGDCSPRPSVRNTAIAGSEYD